MLLRLKSRLRRGSSIVGRVRDRLHALTWVAHSRQYAALPWREGKDGLEILLITSRETRRWVIPKGWPMITLAAHDAAAQEAFEEAGVRGTISETPIGAFRYRKRLKTGKAQLCRVDVFPLAVATELKSWPERRQRQRRWIPALEAARMVEEPGLRRLIEAFAEAETAAA
ncbi:MAG: NUDIX hydrolase [Caulobacter sp.]|nr:NUDIX hydrolase [Caulobacter sp.]